MAVAASDLSVEHISQKPLCSDARCRPKFVMPTAISSKRWRWSRLLGRTRRAPEPALNATRAEVGLLGDESFRWRLVGARRLWAAQEVHIYASNLAVAELHIEDITPQGVN